jgi:hypothetical protein
VAVFSGLELFQPASGYTLRATASAVSAATTSGISVALSSGSFADSGFESPNVGSSFQSVPAASPWTFSGTAGVAGNSSGYTSGNPAAPQGTQVAYLQINGSVSQSISFTAGTYDLTFYAAQRSGSNQTFVVLVDGSPVASVTPTGTSYLLQTTASFTVAAGTHTVAFVGLDPAGGDNTALIDDVLVQTATANQPIDPGFELPSVGSGNIQYRPTGVPWAFSGDAGVAGNSSGLTSGNPAAP